MNKIEALKAAQKEQINAADNSRHYTLQHDSESKKWCLYDGVKLLQTFPYEDPKPLAQDTYIWAKNLRLYLYAMGEFSDHGFNKCYPPGRCSKNADGFEDFISVDEFKIIETPTDFETMQTPDAVCENRECKKYANKRLGRQYWLHSDCQRCRISVSEPTGLKGE